MSLQLYAEYHDSQCCIRWLGAVKCTSYLEWTLKPAKAYSPWVVQGINLPDISSGFQHRLQFESINRIPEQKQCRGPRHCSFFPSSAYSSFASMDTLSTKSANVRTFLLAPAPTLTYEAALEHKLKVAMRKSMQISETVLEELERDNNRHVRELRRWFFRDQDLPRVKSKLSMAFDSRYPLTPYSATDVYSSMQKYKEFNKPNTDNLIQPVSSVFDRTRRCGLIDHRPSTAISPTWKRKRKSLNLEER